MNWEKISLHGAFKYKVIISDDGRHCKVIDPDGLVLGENIRPARHSTYDMTYTQQRLTNIIAWQSVIKERNN